MKAFARLANSLPERLVIIASLFIMGTVFILASSPIHAQHQETSQQSPPRFAYLAGPVNDETETPEPGDAGGEAIPTQQPPPTIFITSIKGWFFTDPSNNCVVAFSPATTPVFKQNFPILNFNPTTPVCATTPVNPSTTPFTDL